MTCVDYKETSTLKYFWKDRLMTRIEEGTMLTVKHVWTDRKIQQNEKELELNGTQQLLAYDANVNLMDEFPVLPVPFTTASH